MKRIAILAISAWLTAGCSPKREVHQIGTFHPESERFWEVIPRETVVENIGVGFQFTEGPAWHHNGILLFSDIPESTVYRWNGRNFREFRKPSNHSNGLQVEPDGSVLACEHGSRSVTRYSQTGELTILADRYRGKRFNSPNDLCRSADGAIYFTDPPFGLPGGNGDPARELPYSGVYRFHKGEITLLDSTLSRPNGIALSPDENLLYVADYEIHSGNGEGLGEMIWMRYAIDNEGHVLNKEVFFSVADPSLPGGPDGMEVDRRGNLFLTGPGGILVVDTEGEHLGTIGLPVPASNLEFGPREKVLYVTARSTVVRISLRQRTK